MKLPLGVSDPLFTHELALELGMTVSEIGVRMSAHELTVEWPMYFKLKKEQAEKEDQG